MLLARMALRAHTIAEEIENGVREICEDEERAAQAAGDRIDQVTLAHEDELPK
jgi:hypothetical protein